MKFEFRCEVYDLAKDLANVLYDELADSDTLKEYAREHIDDCYGEVIVADNPYKTSEVVEALGDLDIWMEDILDSIEDDARHELERGRTVTVLGLTFEPVDEDEDADEEDD